jgi:cbb3-type cytochrome oxidase subunit 1
MQAEVINRRLVKFVWAALIFFAWSIIQGAIQAQEPVRTLLQQGPGGMIGGAHTHIGLIGWMSLALMTLFYYAVPAISGKSIVWPKLIDWIFWIFVPCTAASGALEIIGGAVGGNAFAAGIKGAQLGSLVFPYSMSAGLLCTIAAIAGLMFVVQILVSVTRGSKASS